MVKARLNCPATPGETVAGERRRHQDLGDKIAGRKLQHGLRGDGVVDLENRDGGGEGAFRGAVELRGAADRVEEVLEVRLVNRLVQRDRDIHAESSAVSRTSTTDAFDGPASFLRGFSHGFTGGGAPSPEVGRETMPLSTHWSHSGARASW